MSGDRIGPRKTWEPSEEGTAHAAKTGRWRGAAPGRKSHTVYAKRVILLVGTLGRGIDFYGPFENGLVAMKWAGDNLQVGADVRMEILNDVRE